MGQVGRADWMAFAVAVAAGTGAAVADGQWPAAGAASRSDSSERTAGSAAGTGCWPAVAAWSDCAATASATGTTPKTSSAEPSVAPESSNAAASSAACPAVAAFPAGRSSDDRSAVRAGTASEVGAGNLAGSDFAFHSAAGLECAAKVADRVDDDSLDSSDQGTFRVAGLHWAFDVEAASEASACHVVAESARSPVRDVAVASGQALKSAENCDEPVEVPDSPVRAGRAWGTRDAAAVAAASGNCFHELVPVAASAAPFDLSERCDADEEDSPADIAAVATWGIPGRIAASCGWAGNLRSETVVAMFHRLLPPSPERGAWACSPFSASADCSIGGC